MNAKFAVRTVKYLHERGLPAEMHRDYAGDWFVQSGNVFIRRRYEGLNAQSVAERSRFFEILDLMERSV